MTALGTFCEAIKSGAYLKIAIIDYGMGNLGSIRNMLLRLGIQSEITANHKIIRESSKIILPGVGAFDAAVSNLKKSGLDEILNEQVLGEKKPILGICLGFQLFTKGSEEGDLEGFGWIDANTVMFRFDVDEMNYRVPHMGWNTIVANNSSPILSSPYENTRYYFVHSYHVRCNDPKLVLATTKYGIVFHSAAIKDNIIGVQFHPEKSHKFGMNLLANFAEAGR